ncbi:MAG: hypothetical protein JSV03_05685 [Planctomycetota bacterium]|nr:MAG: hypothetical protein JSV03_05685 [Planctomycetota bacterium]
MSQVDLDRVREDLATVKQAAGMELPFGWEDVWLNVFVLSVGGMVAVIWTFLPHSLPHSLGLIPLLIVAVVYGIRLRIKYRRSTGRSSIRRREYTASFVIAAVVGTCAIVYRLWGTRLGLPLSILQGIAIFFVGLMLVGPAVLDRSRIYCLGISLPFILCGLAIPLLSIPAVALVGGACVVSGLAMAAIQAWQLRAQEVIRNRATD